MQKVGWYRELRHGDPSGPSLHDAEALAPAVQERVLAHLGAGRVVLAAPGLVTDVVTGAPVGPLSLLTDGEWVWPSDLAHYVETRHSPLPPAFVEHVVATPSYRVSDAQVGRVAAELAPPTPEPAPRVAGLFTPQPGSRMRVRGVEYTVLGIDDTGLGTVIGVDPGTGAVWSVAMQPHQQTRFVNSSAEHFTASLTLTADLRAKRTTRRTQAEALREVDAAALDEPAAWWPTVLGGGLR